MKHSITIVCILICLLGNMVPAWGQSSTEGKDFWLASTIVCQPPTASKAAVPYIAVSAKQACSVTIRSYNGTVVAGPTNVAAGTWTEFKNIPSTAWYPNVVSADDVHNQADQKHNYGLHVTATEDISVFVVVRATNSMDASNILPQTALMSEYYTQDFYPNAKDVNTNVSMVTILGTVDNTTVAITPSANTYGKNNAGQTFNITLNQGETYYLVSAASTSLAGTHIVAQENKPIAVFCGDPLTRIPAGISARDGLYEQVMPIDYWGMRFIATRSKDKDGSVVGITALEDGTQIRVNNTLMATINHGQTYYFMMQNLSLPNSNKPGDRPFTDDNVIIADAAYIETSCPCAAILYDTGNAFYGKTGSEFYTPTGKTEDNCGDPSSVWLAPIEQSINEITFGTCYTDKTRRHFLNVVTPTATASSTSLQAYINNRPVDISNMLQWTVIPSKPDYSYARVLVSNDNESLSTFTLKNPSGVIAHVYGNGDDESYAYSVGSSAVKRGIRINGNNFTDGYIYPDQFCINDSLEFDAQVGSDIITAVDWDFGDGITELNGDIQTQHQYLTPGWFDASARVRAQKACSEETYPVETIHFSFYVNLPDTVGRRDSVCAGEPWPWDGKIYDHDTTIIYNDGQCDTIYRYSLHVGQPSPQTTLNTIAKDSFVYEGKSYYASQQLTFHYDNQDKCDSTVVINLTVHTSLDLTIGNAFFDCNNSTTMLLPYTIHKGDGGQMDNLLYHHQGAARTVTKDGTNFYLDIDGIDPGTYVDTLTVQDNLIDSLIVLPFVAEIYYPSSIFAYKYNNVLAVYQNKGYVFTAYQWYINNMPVIGANKSVYHQPDGVPFNGETAYVVLSRYDVNGQLTTARSCEQMLPYKDVEPSRPAVFNTSKRLIQDHIYVFREEGIYDAYGRRIR